MAVSGQALDRLRQNLGRRQAISQEIAISMVASVSQPSALFVKIGIGQVQVGITLARCRPAGIQIDQNIGRVAPLPEVRNAGMLLRDLLSVIAKRLQASGKCAFSAATDADKLDAGHRLSATPDAVYPQWNGQGHIQPAHIIPVFLANPNGDHRQIILRAALLAL